MKRIFYFILFTVFTFSFGIEIIYAVDITCTNGLLGSPKTVGTTAYYLQTALDILKYLAIIALIVLSIVDYAKAVTESDPDAIKRSTQLFGKRLVLTIILFLFPVLLKILFDLTGIYGSSDPFCGIS